MNRKMLIPIALLLVLVLFACSLPGTATPSAAPTDTATSPAPATATATQPAATPAPSTTKEPGAGDTPTATTAPSNTPLPTNTTAAPAPAPAASSYIDDRSTPSQVIVSLYNAINRKEYLRAYSYWDRPATDYPSFANGYQDTAAVALVFGPISGDAGMSQVYYTVPVILKVTLTSGPQAEYAACYIVHSTSPGVYGAPPFQPMGIDRGSAAAADPRSSDASVLATACSSYPSGPGPVPASGTSLSIDKNNFLDNRSGAIETVSSFLNALNRKEYVRAYFYFQDPTAFPGAYQGWSAGYADTDTITVIFGTVQSEGAAGSLYYKVPLAEKAVTTANITQTFVGCYTLRLTQPGVQGVPPFQPMGIIAGKFSQVANNADVNGMMGSACN